MCHTGQTTAVRFSKFNLSKQPPSPRLWYLVLHWEMFHTGEPASARSYHIPTGQECTEKKRAGGEGGGMWKFWFCKVLKGSIWILQSKGQFDVTTTVYSKANHAKTSKIPNNKKNKTADPIGALVWLCGHVVCSFVFFFWFSRFWPSGADHAKT